MKVAQIITFTFIVLLTSCSTESPEEESKLIDTTAKVSISEAEIALLDLINARRTSLGLNRLIMDASIYTYASQHNEYMINDDAISHDNFGTRSYQVKAATNAANVSENVARFFNNNKGVLNGWLRSPSHKATLEGNFSNTVISITEDSNGKKYYTQLFYN